MGLRARILRVLETGPRKRNVLQGLARGKEDFDTTFVRLIEAGRVVMYGEGKGTTYGLPKRALN